MCKKKPGGPRNVTDQWCEDNCRGEQRSACVSSNRVDQKCVCSRDVTIIAKGTEGFEISYRKVTEKQIFWFIFESDILEVSEKIEILVFYKMIFQRGHSKTTLSNFCPILKFSLSKGILYFSF